MRRIKLPPRHIALLALAALALPAAAQVRDHRDLKFPELPPFRITRPEVFKLKNGLTLFLLEDHGLPLIAAEARIRTGSNYEPADKVGLSDIFGQVLREGGTTRNSGDEIDEFLATRAASIETGMGGDSGFASMECLADDFDDVFLLYNDILRHPVFDGSKIELARRQIKSGIARRNDNVDGIVEREFTRLMYGADSPMGRLAEYATVNNVGRADLVAWHAAYFHPNNVYLGIVGDFDSATMKQKIRSMFGDWKRGPDFGGAKAGFETSKPGVYFVEKEDVTQANIRMGHLGIEAGNPDYFAVQVMNEVFGGSFSSRLFGNVRSEKGLAYSVFGGVGSAFLHPGVFQVGTSTKSKTMAAAVDALREEIRGIIDRPPTAAELKRAKETILNSFVFNYSSTRQLLSQQMTYSYYGLPADFLERYRGNLENVTREDTARVARKYIHPDRLALLVVGRAADFDRPLDEFGEVTRLDIGIPPDTGSKLARTADSLEAGSALFARAARSINGGNGERVRSVLAELTLAVDLGGQAISLSQSVSYELPDKVHQTLRTPMGEQVMVINGDRGVLSRGGQTLALSVKQIEEGFKDLGRELLVLAGNVGHPDIVTVAGGAEDVAGAPCDVVEVSFMGVDSRLFVDDSGKVLKQAYHGRHPFQGTPGLIEILFHDYRNLDGRLIPHRQVMNFEGRELGSISLEGITINPNLDRDLFDLPDGG